MKNRNNIGQHSTAGRQHAQEVRAWPQLVIMINVTKADRFCMTEWYITGAHRTQCQAEFAKLLLTSMNEDESWER